jgi:hypothetical protein
MIKSFDIDEGTMIATYDLSISGIEFDTSSVVQSLHLFSSEA